MEATLTRSSVVTRVASVLRADALAVAVFVGALIINIYGIGWGLPNGNETWAADAIQPGAPLAVLYRMFLVDPWNSGWFWFKYPLGHVLLLGGAYAPYLAWLTLAGKIGSPTSTYPYGMADPGAALCALALIGRGLSAVMGAGCVLCVYFVVKRRFGAAGAAGSAFVTALCYPLVYYAHTTNVEVPYVFWMLLAFAAASYLLREPVARPAWLLLGVAAAMSISTKELSAGFFLPMPLLLAAAALARGVDAKVVARFAALAGLAAAVTLLLANNVVLNPQGFLNRIAFLTHRLPAEVATRYAPYYFPIELGAGRPLSAEIEQLRLTGAHLLSSLGPPSVALALIGAWVALRRDPWWAALSLLCALSFYLFGARAMLSLSLRYVLPIAVIATTLAGIGLAALVAPGRWTTVRRLLAIGAVVYVFAYGWDVNRMLANDPRYDAEDWLRANVRPHEVVEVYQRPTYLPRAPEGVQIETVPFAERNVEAFGKRRPAYVLLSSAGLSGMTLEYRRDWKGAIYDPGEWRAAQRSPAGDVMNYERKANVELLEGLLDGSLGYRVAARFSFRPWIERPLIRSLNPTITIYRRSGADGESP